MLKRIFSDGSLLCLLLFNGYLIWYYHQNSASFKTLVWLYWIQSVMIGVFNAFDIFTTKNAGATHLQTTGWRTS